MPKVTEAIRNFLSKRKATHNGPDLIERFLDRSSYMEVQVNVSAGDGWAVDGKRSTYTDGLDEWFNIRIPKNANSSPEFRDYELSWPLDIHADAIGCTGWDWSARRSRWVGFDFDSITGHAAGVGVTDEELGRVREAAKALPYVEVRSSTGGNGLHLYVLFDDAGIPTANHTEHAALGRAILGMMSSETGFDFGSQIDACGGNMWIWARKMTPENGGLKLLKEASQSLSEDDLPANWRDHIEVISRKRARVKVNGLEDKHLDPFETLATSRRIVPLDKDHKNLIDQLGRTGYSAMWVSDYHLLQTHTCALGQLMNDRKHELNLIGFFKTTSEGRDKGTPNCFAFPIENGGWKVYRFTPGISEAETWEQDGEGWTTCYFNKHPNLKVAARAMGGIEDADKGGFVFDSFKGVAEAALALGLKVSVPDYLVHRTASMKSHRDGRLVARIELKPGDSENPEVKSQMKSLGWLAKRDYWVKVFDTKTESSNDELASTEFDNVIRALVSPDGKRAGWVTCQADSGDWVWAPKDDAKSALLALQYTKPESEVILGRAAMKGWKLVNMPFHPEFPGNRQWNYKAAQYRYTPADLADDEAPHHPHWDMILRHCGQDLDESIRDLEWARNANIRTGADYLLHWAACMLREPYEKLPYLFMYGDQNSGKSIFGEALSLLMSGGVAAADRALMSDFNGELANAVLALVEERDISISPGSYNRLKDWVTGNVIWIRKMRTDAYPQINTLHFIQTANERDALIIKSGDTRIVVIFVPALDPGQEIPKPILLQRLQDEAPHFMRTIMDLRLPPMLGRLRLPVVSTSTKERAEELSRNPLETFLADNCFEVPGHLTAFSEFFESFERFLDEERSGEEQSSWSGRAGKLKVIKELPHRFPYGKHNQNVRYIGNLSLEPKSPTNAAKPLVVRNGRLKPRD